MAGPDLPEGEGKVPGRLSAVRGREGFFRAGRDPAGRWWLIDGEGGPFFARAVHGVRLAEPQGDGALPRDSAALLRGWGFNAVGVVEDGVHDDGLPFMAAVEFCAGVPLLQAPGLRLPDVFDPHWTRAAASRAGEVCTPLARSPALIGWVTDQAIAWGQSPERGRPSLLQLCLSLEPGFAAYHAAWEFVLAHHGGRLDAVGRAWGVEMPNREVVRDRTRRDAGIDSRGYLRDQARWTRELARRYFATTSAAVRAADPNHLVLGCRLGRGTGGAVLAESVYPAVDVAMPDWCELPPAESSQPFLAGEVGWAREEFLRAPAGGAATRSTAVERMLRRARVALDRVARHPAAVGYVWSQWQDAPGEQPPFARGLVHRDGTEAREHTELLTQFNDRLGRLRVVPEAGVAPR